MSRHAPSRRTSGTHRGPLLDSDLKNTYFESLYNSFFKQPTRLAALGQTPLLEQRTLGQLGQLGRRPIHIVVLENGNRNGDAQHNEMLQTVEDEGHGDVGHCRNPSRVIESVHVRQDLYLGIRKVS